MNCVGIDLHKKTIVLCVVNPLGQVLQRRTFACLQTQDIRDFFARCTFVIAM